MAPAAIPAPGIFSEGASSPSSPTSTGEEGGAVREDQVSSAVQFLTHPKVQASSLEERRKFLVKKGLTGAEIEEAIRQAQPVLEQQASANPPRGGGGTQPAPGLFSEPQPVPHLPHAHRTPPAYIPSPPRQGHQLALPKPLVPQTAEAPSNGWARVLLASMAVAGMGGGLGLLARKVLRKDGEPLGSIFGGGGAERAAAAAAAAAEARREAAALAASSELVKNKVDKAHDKLDLLLRSIDKLQACVDGNTRAVERMDDRVAFSSKRAL